MTGNRTTTDGAVGMERAEGARNAPITPINEAVERLERYLSGPSPYTAYRGAPPPGVPRLGDDLRTVLEDRRQSKEREAVMREALTGIWDVSERMNPDQSFNSEARLKRCAEYARTALHSPDGEG